MTALIVAVSLGAAACSGSTPKADAAPLRLEPASDAGADPFSDSMAVGVPTSFPSTVDEVTRSLRTTLETDDLTGTLVATGTTPGLFGGSGDRAVCDPDELVAFLDAHRAKARAWAKVLGIEPKQIETFVSGLTPVVLTNDTRVTNHGYRSGAATTVQSVLQAGTAVMVDARGVPRVKCNCGNPLTPPRPIAIGDATTEGQRWTGYSPQSVTVIEAGPRPASSFNVVNVDTGASYDQPVLKPGRSDGNSSGGPKQPAVGRWVDVKVDHASSRSTIATSPDLESWTAASTIDHVAIAGLAHGKGGWIAVGTDPAVFDSEDDIDVSTKILHSDDLATWKEVATVPDELASIAYGNGRWTAAGSDAQGSGITSGPGVVYESTDGTSWSLVARLSGSQEFNQPPVAYGGGDWLSLASDYSTADGTSFLSAWASADGEPWAATGGTIPSAVIGAVAWDGKGHRWLATAEDANQDPDFPSRLYASTDGAGWVQLQVQGLPEHSAGVTSLIHGGGRWVAAGLGGTWSSQDLVTWTEVGTAAADTSVEAYGPVSD